VPNARKRGRPKGSKNKKPRAKRGRRESTASTALSDAARARLPGARGPPPGSKSARWSPELKGYALGLYDLRKGELTATVNELVRKRPQDYGRGRAICSNGKPAAALSTELLRQWVAKRDAAPPESSWFQLSVGGKRAGAGRHRLLPQDIMARMAAAKTPLPTADNLAAVIAEVTTNADAAASLLASDAEESAEESDEEVDEDEEEGEDEEEEEGATGGGAGGSAAAATAPADVAGGAPGNPA
jgi:hypothetical protein